MNKLYILLALALIAVAKPAAQDSRFGQSCNADNLYRCFVRSKSLALTFCSAYLASTVIQTDSVIPTATFRDTRTTTEVVVTTKSSTATLTSTPTVTVTISKTLTSFRRNTSIFTTTDVVYSLPSAKKERDVQYRNAPEALLRCLSKDGSASTSYVVSRITSACSCIGVIPETVQATTTLEPITQRTTVTVIASSTSIRLETITITITRSIPATIKTTTRTTTTTTTGTTVTVTSTATSKPSSCASPATFEAIIVDQDAGQTDLMPDDFIFSQRNESSLQTCCATCSRQGCVYYAFLPPNDCVTINISKASTAHFIPGDPVFCPFGLVGVVSGDPVTPFGLSFGVCAAIGSPQ